MKINMLSSVFVQVAVRAMARGQQKIQSQQKNAKKAAEKKKSQGADQKSAAKAALVHTCPVCRVSAPLQQDAVHPWLLMGFLLLLERNM